MILNLIRLFTGGQCRSDRTGVTWSSLREHVIRWAAAFVLIEAFSKHTSANYKKASCRSQAYRIQEQGRESQ